MFMEHCGNEGGLWENFSVIAHVALVKLLLVHAVRNLQLMRRPPGVDCNCAADFLLLYFHLPEYAIAEVSGLDIFQ